MQEVPMLERLSGKNILASIIKAIDLYNPLLKDHHRRTAIMAYAIGRAYGLEKEKMNTLFLSASLHDIGALHIKERDELLKVDVEDPSHHEILGALMLDGFKPLEPIARIIKHHHIRYDDFISGQYAQEVIPIECFILNLADRMDVLSLQYQGQIDYKEVVAGEVTKRFGSVFMPDLYDAFCKVVHTDSFWAERTQSTFGEMLFASMDDSYHELDDEGIKALAVVLAKIVDFKSHWTVAHSQKVGVLAGQIAMLMQLPAKDCFELTIAGYLHDIGKVAIPTEIIDKPGSLSEDERMIMKSHVVYTSIILESIHGLERIAKWASNHHEKRNQSGYPRKIGASEFEINMDIIVFADLISAFTEDRPYRAQLKEEEVLNVLKSMVPEALSNDVYEVIQNHFNELYMSCYQVSTYQSNILP